MDDGKPVLVDLFCGAGGAAKGYAEAGFQVIGVDHVPQPRYPYTFLELDALRFLRMLILGCTWGCLGLRGISAFHASPPCQGYSKMSKCRPGNNGKYPDLIAETRELFTTTGLPYVIENVKGSPLIDPVWICGCQIPLTCEIPGLGKFQLRRPRGFETNFPVVPLGEHDHSLYTIMVAGNGPDKKGRARGKGYTQGRRDVMGIDWMNHRELSEAIPPAFTEHVGGCLMAEVNRRQVAEAE